jgi:hypothetical protein
VAKATKAAPGVAYGAKSRRRGRKFDAHIASATLIGVESPPPHVTLVVLARRLRLLLGTASGSRAVPIAAATLPPKAADDGEMT